MVCLNSANNNKQNAIPQFTWNVAAICSVPVVLLQNAGFSRVHARLFFGSGFSQGSETVNGIKKTMAGLSNVDNGSDAVSRAIIWSLGL